MTHGAQVELLGAVFPLFSYRVDDLSVQLVAFAPRRVDPTQAPPCALLALVKIENLGSTTWEGNPPAPGLPDATVNAAVSTPVESPHPRFTELPVPIAPGYEAVMCLDDTRWEPRCPAVRLSLGPGASAVHGFALLLGTSPVDVERTRQSLVRSTALEWWNETWRASEKRYGRLSVPSEPYFAESPTRLVEADSSAVLYSGEGRLFTGGPSGWVDYGMLLFEPRFLADQLRSLTAHRRRARAAPRTPSPSATRWSTRWGSSPRRPRTTARRTTGSSSGSLPASSSSPGSVSRTSSPSGREPPGFSFEEALGMGRRSATTTPARTSWRGWRSTGWGGSPGTSTGTRGWERSGWTLPGRSAATSTGIAWATVAWDGGSSKAANAPGTFAAGHDGEEAFQPTLAPFFGFCEVDDPALINHAKLAFTPDNPLYEPAVDGIWWGSPADRLSGVTTPGQMAMLVANDDEEGLARRLDQLRSLTDLDGSIWWWPYLYPCNDRLNVRRRDWPVDTSKSGFTMAIAACLLVNNVFGLSVDAPDRRVSLEALLPLGRVLLAGSEARAFGLRRRLPERERADRRATRQPKRAALRGGDRARLAQGPSSASGLRRWEAGRRRAARGSIRPSLRADQCTGGSRRLRRAGRRGRMNRQVIHGTPERRVPAPRALGAGPESPAPSAAPANQGVAEAIGRPWGKLFWIERRNGQYRMGDPGSRYAHNSDFEHLTFDISNNKVLANVGVQGELKSLTIYRDSYGVSGYPVSLPGVWMAKDNSTFGPYSYTLHLQGQAHDLARVDWDFRTGLLDNIFPVTELHDPRGRFLVRLLTYAPASADGSHRVRAAVYGLEIENRSPGRLEGTIELPGTFANQRQDFLRHPIHMWEPFEFEFGRGDSGPFRRKRSRSTSPWAIGCGFRPFFTCPGTRLSRRST